MPLFLAIPLLIKGAAVVAGAVGAGAAVKGAVDSKNANDTMKAAKNRNEQNLEEFQKTHDKTMAKMDELGEFEANIAKDFERFSNAFEQIQNRPEFDSKKLGIDVDKFNFEEIKASSVAAGVLLGAGAGGAGGVALGVAAAVGIKAAVFAFGTASTGTAIATLSGAAATKATLAAIGGGAIAAGGGGVAAGTAILGAATLGVGLLIGGATFAFTGSKLKGKADEAYSAMLENEAEMNENKKYLVRLRKAAERLDSALDTTHKVYDRLVEQFISLVKREKDWNMYTSSEQLLVENNIRIVSVLHKMINTPILKTTETDSEGNPTRTAVDDSAVDKVIHLSKTALNEINAN